MTSVNAITKKLNSGAYDERLLEIYADESLLSYEKERYLKAIEKFVSIYGEEKILIFSAPGRSEVMGNHTDHQQGEILAASVNLDAIAVVHPLKERIVKVTSDGYKEITVPLDDLKCKSGEKGTTKALVKGVLKGFDYKNFKIGGFEAYVTSDVLIGAGLSSSAAFETLLGTILSHLYNKGEVSAIDIAIVGQFAENVYFGKPCGLMDQMACSVGNLVHVDFANPDDPKVEKIEFDLSRHGYSLCITDTKGSHADLTEEYAAIPREMKLVAGYFGQKVLLGITKEDLIQNMTPLRAKFGDRAVLRALHFITENERVKKGVDALKKENVPKFLAAVRASGKSSYELLQNVYTSSDVEHQNVSLALALSEITLDGDKNAFRVHGGGFAGTIQAFVQNADVEKYKKTMESVFGKDSCHVLKIRKEGGVQVI
ncbi:MAG: galactokinase [Lachnospiraceae bacterium]|nr:galactokinase [Lachnospiraceae bacterium]